LRQVFLLAKTSLLLWLVTFNKIFSFSISDLQTLLRRKHSHHSTRNRNRTGGRNFGFVWRHLSRLDEDEHDRELPPGGLRRLRQTRRHPWGPQPSRQRWRCTFCRHFFDNILFSLEISFLSVSEKLSVGVPLIEFRVWGFLFPSTYLISLSLESFVFYGSSSSPRNRLRIVSF